MIKKITKILKKVIMAAIIIYAYNKIALPINAVIPINLITIFLVTILGMPAIVSLVVFSLIFF